jgi:UDP-galactopyranose mutase
VPVPFNLKSLYALFGPREAAALEALLISVYGQDSNVPILKLRQSDRQGLRALADFIYDKVFRGYTTKQWGFSPEQLAPSVTARVPVRVGRDDRYFQDTYQAMPEQGYTALFRRMLDHPNISVMLGVDYLEARQRIDARQVFFTGPIDAYFNYCYGRLPYRSLRFEHECFPDRQVFQAVGTVNYPNDHDYTRITEFKHLSGQVHPGTSIVREYPCNEGDPYYPIPREENERVYRRYEELARQESGVTFVGRLARYKYYNMDQVVASALRRCGVDA